jgi:thiol-disulfide isomerase/thioredoxin
MRRLPVLIGVLALALASAAGAATAPRVGVDSLSQLPTPLPYPYDFGADAHADVASAQARARAAGKLLLIDLGANWCADCRLLEAVMRLPAFAPYLDAHYEVVHVDIGRLDKNLDIPARWGVRRVWAAPTLLVVDPAGRLTNAGHEDALEDARTLSPQAIADWLARWVP